MKKTKVGRTGHSREASNTKSNKQGANIGSLEGVLDFGASNSPSGGSKSLPVERRGGLEKRGKKNKLSLLEKWPHGPKPAGEPPPKDLSHQRQGSRKGSNKERTGEE